MDFFEAQDRARRKTTLLVVYFILAIIAMIILIYCAVVGALAFTFRNSDGRPPIDWVQPQLFLIVSGVTLLIIFFGSLFKTAELRTGGEAVALMLGGRRIPPTTTDPDERRVLNVVEEMAIASGVAVPPVYLLRNEQSVNAFAAGYTADDAVIGVNAGTLDILNRDELQGVIAHEFSHILNGDMRFNLRLVGILHGILLISIIGYHLLRVQGGVRVGRDKGGGGGQIMMIGLATLVVGYVGLVFGRLIKAAVSRQREFLADASAVQFTRNPDTISGALKKIGGLDKGSVIRSPHAETASHMFFGDAFQRWAHSPFATHPSLKARIQRLEPSFDGVYPKVTPRQPPQPDAKKEPGKSKNTSGRLPVGQILGGMGLGLGDRIPLDPTLVIASVGAPTTQHVDQSKELLELIPKPLEEATREPFSARAFLFALLLDSDQKIQQQQLASVEKIEGVETRDETVRLAQYVDEIPAAARLPALEIVQSTLRELSERQYEQFCETIDVLVKADRRISLFEFVLKRIIIQHLDRSFQLIGPPVVQYHSIKAVTSDVHVLVSAFAHLGHSDDEAANHAFQHSMASIDAADEMLPKKSCGLKQIDHALSRLNLASAAIKKRALTAIAICIAADRQVTVKEAELFRAVASSIDCPVPPIVGSQRT